MINWLKTLWNDLGDKKLFFNKYVIPGLAIFFSWGLLGHIVLINLDTNSLVANNGQVTNIAVKFEQGTKAKYKYYPLKIGLSGYSEEFRLSDAYKNEFPELKNKVVIGDTITLFTRYKWQTILGWGKQIDIYQIDKNRQTLFDISKVIAEKKSQATLFTIFSLILWSWYIIYKRTRKS